MATVVPTITQMLPSAGKKMVYLAFSSATASDTFSLSSVFSSIEFVALWRTPATGTIIANTISTTTVTIGSGPSSEAVYGFAVGIA